MTLMRTMRYLAVATAFLVAGAFSALAAEQQTHDCAALYTTKAKETYLHLTAAQIEYCAMRGWDPPGKNDGSFPDYNWLPVGGKPVRTGTAGSIQIGAKQPPATPPGASASSTPVGSTGNLGHFGNLPNQSSQCLSWNGQQVCPRCGVVNGNNVCEVPVLDPATGQITYRPASGNEEERQLQPRNPVAGDVGGQLGPIRIATNGLQLTCGGTMNLSNIETSTVVNATHLAIANPLGAYEPGSVPEFTCSTPPQTGSDGNPLQPVGGGNYDCQPNPEEEDTEEDEHAVRIVHVYARSGNSYNFIRSVRLAKKLRGVDKDNRTRPIRQFVFFNAAQGEVAFRAIQPREEAQDQGGNDGVVYNTADEEKYVLVTASSLISGGSRPSKEKFERYPKAIPDLRIMPPQASEDITMELPLNTEACKDRVLHLDLTTPNLVQQPGTVTNVASIIGSASHPGSQRNEKATLSSDTSILYFQPETFLRLAAPGTFVFRGPIAMELPDVRTLHLYGPTTFTNTRLASGAVTTHIHLAGGGHIEDVEGNVQQRIAAMASFVPPGLTAPYYVIADEKVYLPSGLTLANERDGYVREPSCPPPSNENPCAAPPPGCPAPVLPTSCTPPTGN